MLFFESFWYAGIKASSFFSDTIRAMSACRLTETTGVYFFSVVRARRMPCGFNLRFFPGFYYNRRFVCCQFLLGFNRVGFDRVNCPTQFTGLPYSLEPDMR